MPRFFLWLCKLLVSFSFTISQIFFFLPINREIALIKKDDLCLPDGFTVTAHAGAMMTRSNSLGSIRRIILTDVDTIEFDVSFRPDGTPVLTHDSEPSKNQGTLLSRALSLVAAKEQININLDLKSFFNLPKIQTLVEEADMLGRVFFTGVTLEYTAQVKRECPKIPYYLNISSGDTLETQEAVLKLADDIKGCAAVGVNLSYKQASAQLSKIMQENGLKLSVWTVNKRIDMYKMLAIEPNNITTKRPIVLLKIIEEQNND